MGHRTYIPQLVNFLRIVCKYIVAHRETMIANGPGSLGVKLDAVMQACEALLLVVPADLPTDDEYTG